MNGSLLASAGAEDKPSAIGVFAHGSQRLGAKEGIELFSGPLNLDFYPIQIVKNPVMGGTEIQPDVILRYIRTHIQEFVDKSCSEFNPYDATMDGPKWQSDSPVGAVFNITVLTG